MPIAITINQIQENTDGVEAFGTLVFSGSYVTGGDTLDWTTVSGVSTPNGRIFTPQALPIAGGGFISGSGAFIFGFVAGTTLKNALVKIQSLATGAELAAGAYPAGITGDVNISFDFAWPKLL